MQAQGTFLLCLWPPEVEKQIGPAPDSGSHPSANSCPVLSMELPEIGSPVVFPDKVPNQLAPRDADYNFRDLQHDDQQQLLDICGQGSVQQSRRSSEFALQCCNSTVKPSEKCTISSQFAFQSSILRCWKWVSNGI